MASTPRSGSSALAREIEEYAQRLNTSTGVTDGDGSEGHHASTPNQVKQEAASARAAEISEEEAIAAELWRKRVQVVEDEMQAFRDSAKQRAAEPAPRTGNRLHKNAANKEHVNPELDAYHSAVQHTIENRPHVRVTPGTHGALYITLQNLADGVKKSAQLARNETPGDMSDEALKEAMPEVHKFQVRSFVHGGQMQRVTAYCPRVFCRLRNHVGMSYESFVRLANVAVQGLLQSGDFFFSAKALLCYRRITNEERLNIMALLPEYEKHLIAHPFSLLPQWYVYGPL